MSKWIDKTVPRFLLTGVINTLVGAGMMSHPGVAAKMFEALYNAGININMISTSEIRVTVLIREKEAERAAEAIHDLFDLGD